MADLQRTEQWFADRMGKITASRLRDVKGRDKRTGKYLKAREDYKRQIVAEILTGVPREQIKAKALAWGTEAEPFAVAAYEARIDDLVTLSGFVPHPRYAFIGASPDFLVGTDGGGEIKCPLDSEVHLETLLSGLPQEHIEQIQGGLWVTGRAWWDFISYHPHFPSHLRLYVQRVHRDEAFIADMDAECLQFWAEVQQILKRLNKTNTTSEAA